MPNKLAHLRLRHTHQVGRAHALIIRNLPHFHADAISFTLRLQGCTNLARDARNFARVLHEDIFDALWLYLTLLPAAVPHSVRQLAVHVLLDFLHLFRPLQCLTKVASILRSHN